MGKLIPLVERLKQTWRRKMLVIIDEFDDISSSFYLGERGKQFVKALRTLSEVGVTFMFVGSERMNTIYQSHSADLNKWINRSLDRIENEGDCKALIEAPVRGQIDYEAATVDSIVNYCNGNPFYMHLVAGKVFQHCSQECRTYVSSSDFVYVRRSMFKELGPTNFAHFWEDVPILDPIEKKRAIANNCLFLACLATIGTGRYESIDDLAEVQEQFGLESEQKLTPNEFQEVENKLRQRRVLTKQEGYDQDMEIALPVFKDWLLDSGKAEILPIWSRLQEELARERQDEEFQPVFVERESFPIDEDRLLAVSEQLVYLGSQKDVAEVRRWLRQFDDDSRIEIAYLLLRRLAEKGFVNSGAHIHNLVKMQEFLNAKRVAVGNGSWRIVRNRLNNLYLGHVDSETKSGAATARELAKRMSPGKCSSIEEMHTWARGHLQDDPMLVIVDDFAGTGNTLVRGLNRLWKKDAQLFSELAEQGRVLCCLQSSFPEAIQAVQREFPHVDIVPMTPFGDDVRAFSKDSQIFQDESEKGFAQNVMLQIGRQLVPENPLGYGQMGALVCFHNTIPNNSLPVFWSSGEVNDKEWIPLLQRGSYAS